MGDGLNGTSKKCIPFDPIPGTVKNESGGLSETIVKNPVPPVSISAEASNEAKTSNSLETVEGPETDAATESKPKPSWKMCGAAKRRFRKLVASGMNSKEAKVKCKETLPKNVSDKQSPNPTQKTDKPKETDPPKRDRMSGAARKRFRKLVESGMDREVARVKCKEPMRKRNFDKVSPNPLKKRDPPKEGEPPKESRRQRKQRRNLCSTHQIPSRNVSDGEIQRSRNNRLNRMDSRDIMRYPSTSVWEQSRSRWNERLSQALEQEEPMRYSRDDLPHHTFDDDQGRPLDDLSSLQIAEKLRRLDEVSLRLDLRQFALLENSDPSSNRRKWTKIKSNLERSRRDDCMPSRDQRESQYLFNDRQRPQHRNDVPQNRFIEKIPCGRDASEPMMDNRDINVQNDRFRPLTMKQEPPSDFFGGNNNNNFGPLDSSSFSDIRNNLSRNNQQLSQFGQVSYQNMNQGGRFSTNNDNNFGQGLANHFRSDGMTQQQQRSMDGPWGGHMMGQQPNSPPKQQYLNQQWMNQESPNFNIGGFPNQFKPNLMYGNNTGGPFGGGPGMQQFWNTNQQPQMMNNVFQIPMMGGGLGQGQAMMGVFQNNNIQRGGFGDMQGLIDVEISLPGYMSQPGRIHYN